MHPRYLPPSFPLHPILHAIGSGRTASRVLLLIFPWVCTPTLHPFACSPIPSLSLSLSLSFSFAIRSIAFCRYSTSHISLQKLNQIVRNVPAEFTTNRRVFVVKYYEILPRRLLKLLAIDVVPPGFHKFLLSFFLSFFRIFVSNKLAITSPRLWTHRFCVPATFHEWSKKWSLNAALWSRVYYLL